MQYIQIIRLVLSLLPMIIEVVKAIEAALPEGGTGAAKLALVRDAIQAGYSVANDAALSFEQVWPALESTVSAVVKMFNSIGAFSDSTKA